MSARYRTPEPEGAMPAMPQTPRFGTYEDDYKPYPNTRNRATKISIGDAAPATPRKRVSGTGVLGSKLGKPIFTGSAFSGGTSTPPSTLKRTRKYTLFDDDAYMAKDECSTPTEVLPSSAMKVAPSTPERTPRQKKGMAKSGSNSSINSLGSVSGALFSQRLHDDDTMPSPKKHFKYNILGDVEEEEIQIFTDSKERIPEVDGGPEDPFYTPADATIFKVATPAKGRKGEKVTVTEDSDEEYTHDKGFWQNFRGHKRFKKFAVAEADDADIGIDDDFAFELDATVPDRLRGHNLRSRGLQPRILFPTAAQIAAKKQKEEKLKQQQSITDEEADTDIEETHVTTPAKKVVEKGLKTPRAAKVVAPLSPPTTARTTRSKDVRTDVASASFTSTGSHSQEFQSWQRAKPQGRKRDHSVGDDAGTHKRLRN